RAREVLGYSVATCPHKSHRRLRRLIQPTFHDTRIRDYSPRMADCINAMVDSWRDGVVIDIPSEMLSLLLTAQIDTLFADSLPHARAIELSEDVKTVLRGMFPRTVLPPMYSRLPLRSNLRYNAAKNRFRKTVDEVVATRRRDPTDYGDLLSTLLQSRSTTDAAPRNEQWKTTERSPSTDLLSNEEITDQITAFILAGSESTANAIAWALHLISHSPEIEQRLHSEIDEFLTGNQTAAHEYLPKLSLTDRIITETLRVFPPGWMFTRITTEDTELGGYFIPADTTILYSAYLLHHHPHYFPNSEIFDPDRWSPDRIGTIPKGALVPFGSGARQCIGKDFAVTMATLAVAAIVSRWRLEPLNSQSVQAGATAILYPKNLRMRVHNRCTASSSASVHTR
ncbi:cytochrome P450, partial [Nocardia brasiliensis]|uniref:cytochrome P450 n=1 Tax=Nocardia brasiliensis TaxID=37326 RepID=UPI0024559BEC